MLAAWMDIGVGGIANGFALSTDHGRTWSPAAAVSDVLALGDPVAAIDRAGALYYGYLDGTCSPSGCTNGHLWLARRAPGEAAFAPALDISPADPAEFYDKLWLMVAADGSLVATVAARAGEYPSNVDRLIVARSTDGLQWDRVEALPPRPMGQLAGIPHACASTSSGRIWLLHIDSETPIFARIRWSDEHGVTWPAANASSGFAPPAEVTTLQGYDLRCVGEGDEVWVMHGVSGGASSGESIPPLDEIHLAYSQDGGKTFEHRAVLKEPGRRYLRPEIVLEPGGALDLIAYTGSDEGDPAGAVRLWRSTDKGATFVEQPVLLEPIRFTGSRAGADWIGDYSGLVFHQGAI
jgi:hypothetical protein